MRRGTEGALLFFAAALFFVSVFFSRWPMGDQAGGIGLGGVENGDKIIYLGFYFMGWWAFLLLGQVFFTHGLTGMGTARTYPYLRTQWVKGLVHLCTHG